MTTEEEILLLLKAKMAMDVAPRVSIYKSVVVPANDSKTIFDVKIGSEIGNYKWNAEFLLICTYFANCTQDATHQDWVPDTTGTWERDFGTYGDKSRPGTETFTYQAAAINQPLLLVPKVPIYFESRYSVKNETAGAVTAQVLLEGFIFKKWMFDELLDRFFGK